MKRSQVVLPLFAFLFAASAALVADDGAAHGRDGRAGGHIQRCVSSLNLSATQSAAIQSTLTAGKTTLQTDRQNMMSLHQKMQSDIAAGADKSVVGQDALDLSAARSKLQTDAETIRGQVIAQIPADQQPAFNACTASHTRGHMGGPVQ
jgi:hypothetical protein